MSSAFGEAAAALRRYSAQVMLRRAMPARRSPCLRLCLTGFEIAKQAA